MKIQISETKSVSSKEVAAINAIVKQNFPKSPVSVVLEGSGIGGPKIGCEEACNLAESIAIEACNELSNPIAVALCKAAAKAAGDYCRDQC